MSTNTTTTNDNVTKTYTAQALNAELGRRRNNKNRDKKVQAKSYALAKLSRQQISEIKDGGIVEVTFSSGRVDRIGLKG